MWSSQHLPVPTALTSDGFTHLRPRAHFCDCRRWFKSEGSAKGVECSSRSDDRSDGRRGGEDEQQQQRDDELGTVLPVHSARL
jgi:hypothetical protein